jgi:hypothetical protein
MLKNNHILVCVPLFTVLLNHLANRGNVYHKAVMQKQNTCPNYHELGKFHSIVIVVFCEKFLQQKWHPISQIPLLKIHGNTILWPLLEQQHRRRLKNPSQ